ncbi:MAG: hypothetical protein GXX90_11550 [Microbacteriaceae bacterium]|nr:hypothetical protein [Microbacteriaceae bacterium]
MRASIAVVVALVLLASITGCAAAPAPEQGPAAGPADARLEQLRDLDGVRAAHLDDIGAHRSELVVDLDEAVTADLLAAVGALAESLLDDADSGVHDAVVRLDRSVYNYFDGMRGDELDAQLAYWLALAGTGVDSVTMLSSARGAAPAVGIPGTPTDDAGPAPRYVLVDLPGELPDGGLADIVDRLGDVDDPGAPGGQWDLLDLAPATKGEYAGPDFPDVELLRLDARLGALFADAPGLAGVQLHRDDALAQPLRVQVVVFDPEMDLVGADEAEAAFASTDGFAGLVDAVELLESAHPVDYRATVLSSPLHDGGSFELRFRVAGCAFTGDERWPELSAELGERWAASIAPERRDALPRGEHCTVDGERLPGR